MIATLNPAHFYITIGLLLSKVWIARKMRYNNEHFSDTDRLDLRHY